MDVYKLIRISLCLTLILASLMLGLLTPSSVEAISPPDNGGGNGSIERSAVFQNIFEQGDWLFVSVYNLQYATEPDVAASIAYTYTITTLGGLSIVSNPLNDYYQANIVAIYLNRENAVAYSFGTSGDPWSTWGDPYEAVVQGNPTAFTGTPPAVPDSLTGDYFPSNKASYPISGTALTEEMADSRSLLDLWLVASIKSIEDITGETLITKIGGRDLINNDGAAYVEDAIPGISRITTAFSLREYVPEVISSYDSFDYQQELRGNITITFCEDLEYWESYCNGPACEKATLDLYSIDRMQGDYSVRSQNNAPIAISQYDVVFDPDSDMNLGSRSLVFWWICDRASTEFNQSRVFAYDVDGDYYAWDFSYQQDIGASPSFSLSAPTYSSGTVSLTEIDYIKWTVETLDSTDFTFKIDNVHARGVPGMGVFTEEAFDGLGEWLGVSGTFVGGIFFFIIYLIAASIIYLTTSNHVAALAICIPVILFAILLGVIPIGFMALIIFLMVVAVAYFIWIRGA